MKQKFYFALALTAGLFASCTSDTLSESPALNNVYEEVEDSQPAQINISTSNLGYTRGTGTVGYPTNKWAGQKFNIFMFEKWINSTSEDYVYNNFNAAKYKETDESPEVPIYLNTEMTTDPETQMANYKLGDDIRYNYFPSSGAFSFWAYRIDDALDADAVGEGKPYKYVNDENAEVDSTLATKVIVPIDIDGSQDIMIAITDTATALTTLNTKLETQGKELATQSRIYTAYAARRAVNPRLSFKHLLTRLYFQVVADDRAVSDKADWLINNDEAASRAAGQTFQGFKITDITVYTKSKGHVVAAFNDLSRVNEPRLVFDEGQNWGVGNINTGVATLKAAHLKTRDKDIDPAQIVMQAVNKTYLGQVTVSTEGYVFGGQTNFTLADDMVCYTSNALKANGEPAGEPTTVAAAKEDATVTLIYLATYKSGAREDGSLYNVAAETTDLSAPLRDLDPDDKDAEALVPLWSDDFVAPAPAELAWHVITPEIVSYTWTVTTDADDTAAAVAADAAPTAATAGTVGDVKSYTDGTYTTTCYKLTAIVYNVTGAAAYADQDSDPATDGAEGTENQIVYVGSGDPTDATCTYYKYYAEGAEGVAGEAIPTQMGEALLVAPADENGYWVEFTYTRFKKITDTRVEPLTSRIGIQVTAGDGFKAGKSYRITARLYKDGDIIIGEDDNAIQPDEWEEDDETDPDYTGGTDQKEWDLEDPNS